MALVPVAEKTTEGQKADLMIDLFKDAHVAMSSFADAMKAGMHFLQAEEVLRARSEKKQRKFDEKNAGKKRGAKGEKGQKREPTAYNIFMKSELKRVKQLNPELGHKEAFTAAAKGWASSAENPKSEAGAIQLASAGAGGSPKKNKTPPTGSPKKKAAKKPKTVEAAKESSSSSSDSD